MGYTRFIKSGDIVEIYEYERNLPERRKPKKKGGRRSPKSDTRRSDNVERLRRNFVRLIRSNLVGDSAPAFFTLTFAEIIRVELAYRVFTRFVQRLRREYGSHIRYIGVPEYQKRGAIHFHVLVWGFSEEKILNESPHWVRQEDIGRLDKIERGSREIQRLWAYGYVDCFLTDGSPKLANYVAKYMHKAVFDQRLHGQKSYVCSRNVLRPLSIPSSSVIGAFTEITGLELSTAEPLRDKSFKTQWLGIGRYRSFNLNDKKHENNRNEEGDLF